MVNYKPEFSDANWNDLVEGEGTTDIALGKEQLKGFLQDIKILVDEEEFLTAKSKKKHLKSNDHAEVKFSELGSVSAGSTILIKNNIAGFSEYLMQRNASLQRR